MGIEAANLRRGSGLVIAQAAVAAAQGIEWKLVNWNVRHDFPSVPRIDPKQLVNWLNDSKREQPLLLDVRTKAEFEVSHIHGAKRVGAGLKCRRDQPAARQADRYVLLRRLPLRRFRQEVAGLHRWQKESGGGFVPREIIVWE